MLPPGPVPSQFSDEKRSDSSKGDERSVFHHGESRTMMWFGKLNFVYLKLLYAVWTWRNISCTYRESQPNYISENHKLHHCSFRSKSHFPFTKSTCNTHRQTKYRLRPHSKCQTCITLDFCEAESLSSHYLPVRHKLTCSLEVRCCCGGVNAPWTGRGGAHKTL